MNGKRETGRGGGQGERKVMKGVKRENGKKGSYPGSLYL